MCRNYQCAWSQTLLSIEMRPDLLDILVSVEHDNVSGKQFLKVISDYPLTNSQEEYFNNWCEQHNTFYKVVTHEN